MIDPTDPAKREYMLIDDAVVGTTLSMTSVAKRNLSGSAGAVEHASGAEVRISPPMAQLFEDAHDRIDAVSTVANAALPKAGGTMTGALVLSGAPTVDLHAATKAYVDAGGGASFAGCRLSKSTTQVITTATTTLLTFDTETIDTNAFHSTSADTGRITIPAGKDGTYRIFGHVHLEGGGAGARYLFLFKNADVLPFLNVQLSESSTALTTHFEDYIALVATDYITVKISQSSGGDLDVSGNDALAGATVFGCERSG